MKIFVSAKHARVKRARCGSEVRGCEAIGTRLSFSKHKTCGSKATENMSAKHKARVSEATENASAKHKA